MTHHQGRIHTHNLAGPLPQKLPCITCMSRECKSYFLRRYKITWGQSVTYLIHCRVNDYGWLQYRTGYGKYLNCPSNIVAYAIAARVRDRWSTGYVSRVVIVPVTLLPMPSPQGSETGGVQATLVVPVALLSTPLSQVSETGVVQATLVVALLVPVALLSTPLSQVSETGAVVIRVPPSLLIEAIEYVRVLLSAPMSHVSDLVVK